MKGKHCVRNDATIDSTGTQIKSQVIIRVLGLRVQFRAV